MAKDSRVVSSIKKDDIFDGQAFDGCYFRKDAVPETIKWSYNFMRFGQFVKIAKNEELQTECWLIVLFEPVNEDSGEYNVVYYQAYLGDPLCFVKNQVKANSQGIVIKKCVPGFKIILETIKGYDLSIIQGQLETDLHYFEKS